MTEQKVKNRGWVKNVAIIFLAVMLVLTFFSNTIMNASLPEAAVQYVQSGAITTQIRGTGTISAKETYEVKTSTSRKVQSVLVSRGQQVKVGDVLILLAAGEGSELKDLQTSWTTRSTPTSRSSSTWAAAAAKSPVRRRSCRRP